MCAHACVRVCFCVCVRVCVPLFLCIHWFLCVCVFVLAEGDGWGRVDGGVCGCVCVAGGGLTHLFAS